MSKLDDIIDDIRTDFDYNAGGIKVAEKGNAHFKQQIKDLIKELIDQPVDIIITNDLPSLLDMGETAAKHFDYFRDKLKSKVDEL